MSNQPGRPQPPEAPRPVPMTETPEFKAAVAEAAKEAAALAVRETMELLQAQAAKPAGDHLGVMDGLAMALAELTDQNSGNARKRISPEVMKQRAQARMLMEDLMKDVADRGMAPVYELRGKVYIDEVVIDPLWLDAAKRSQSTRIEWFGVPNESMKPVNEPARLIHQAYLDSIGSVVKQADPGYLTPRGVVIQGRAPLRREVGAPNAPSSGLRIVRDRSEIPGEYEAINVLGTLAPAARQTA